MEQQQFSEMMKQWEASKSGAFTAQEKRGGNFKSWGKKKANNNNTGRPPMPKTNVFGARMQGLPTALPVAGTRLSTASSELKNDPLYQDAYMPSPSEEFREVADRPRIFSGCEAFPVIAAETYTVLSASSPNYKKVVPRSAHDYYLGMLLYARLLRLHEMSDHLTYEEKAFVEQITVNHGTDGGYTVPHSFASYLAGFGNTTLPGGRDIMFGFRHPALTSAVFSGVRINGFFGRIQDNMGNYASYVSPGVLASRIIADLDVHNNDELDWDLPDEIADPEHAINVNCLGYEPAVPVAGMQMDCYRIAGITPLVFPTINGALPLNAGLMNYVHRMMMGINGLKVDAIPLAAGGSVGQLCYETVTRVDTRLGLSRFKSSSLLRLPSPPGYVGATFLYMIDKVASDLASIVPVDYYNDPIPEGVGIDLRHNQTASDESLFFPRFETVEFNTQLRLARILPSDVSR